MSAIDENSIGQQELIDVLSSLLVDVTAQKTALDALVTKVNTDFTAQNLAVTGSQLDEDYASSGALTTTVS